MSTLLERHNTLRRRRERHAATAGQRLDIQGLRMVAVLTVFANHLWGWPHGGFVGVDVFFVISGFLITGNLLRGAEATGTVSFRRFYLNRVRRIVPAATVVLIFTYIAAVLVFLPFRSEQVGVDALFAFIFMANWNFAVQDTDYFQEGDAVSPIQHYWSLSIEEQFYFVWPALIFLISVIVLRRAWTHSRRMRLAGVVMVAVVTASFGWAVYQTMSAPVWAYFDTFSRVWELGVGALLATAAGLLVRIPDAVRPFLSWGGLALIAASLFLIGEGSIGFPAPWALLPVAGAALVVAAGVGSEPRYQRFLRNRASTYIGDISYSLYLVHWPVIVIVSALMEAGPSYYVTVIATAFGLAIASYHFVENPLRRADWGKLNGGRRALLNRQYTVRKSSQYALLGSLALVTVALAAFVLQPQVNDEPIPSAVALSNEPITDSAAASLPKPGVGPLGAVLQGEIAAALGAREWPALSPSMESVIGDPSVNPELSSCGNPELPNPANCTFGSPAARTRIVLVGDSIAMTYVGPLRTIALNSDGQIQLHIQAMDGCQFVNEQMSNNDQSKVDACPARKQHAVDVINSLKPTDVIIANQYGRKIINGTNASMSPDDWAASMREIVAKFRPSTQRVVFLSPPPPDVEISECYGTRSSTPARCISRVTAQWSDIALAESRLASELAGVWMDARPWFCSDGQCPSFVGSTPTKRDQKHMTNAYGEKITPVIKESLSAAGVLPAGP